MSGSDGGVMLQTAASCTPPSARTPSTPRDGASPVPLCTSPARPSSFSQMTPALFTPANPSASVTPPSCLRRESLLVPPSAALQRICKGSGVTVYRMDRAPDSAGNPSSPWVIKKVDVEPRLVRERRRVERTLEHESRILSHISHPHIIGFRAAQRLPDGQLCLAMESCECSLYNVIQDRQFASCGHDQPLFEPSEICKIGGSVSSALAHLHDAHGIMHGDIKSANVLLSRGLTTVKLCDLGVSLPLNERREIREPDLHFYEGTEPWRPPESLLCGTHAVGWSPDAGAGAAEGGGESAEDLAAMRLCDRSDVFAFGLVIWEMLTGEVPHAADLRRGVAAYRAALGTRPQLPALSPRFDLPVHVFWCCTHRVPSRRPAASEVVHWLEAGVTDGQPRP